MLFPWLVFSLPILQTSITVPAFHTISFACLKRIANCFYIFYHRPKCKDLSKQTFKFAHFFMLYSLFMRNNELTVNALWQKRKKTKPKGDLNVFTSLQVMLLDETMLLCCLPVCSRPGNGSYIATREFFFSLIFKNLFTIVKTTQTLSLICWFYTFRLT